MKDKTLETYIFVKALTLKFLVLAVICVYQILSAFDNRLVPKSK